MSVQVSLHAELQSEAFAPPVTFEPPSNCTQKNCSALALYDRELKARKAIEVKLRKSAMRERILLREQAALIRQKEMLNEESEHRLLNGLQLIASLLGMQSRATNNPEVAAQLNVASLRVASIGRIHRHLHKLDRIESVEFKQYLETLSRDLSEMVSSESRERQLVVEGDELTLPTRMGIPLGFIASELITNSIKYAKGCITVRLQSDVGMGHSLTISDDGPGLPEYFDPAATGGLGMKLVSSLVKQINGRLEFGRGDNDQGTQFTVTFPNPKHDNSGSPR